ncbi:MAG: permease [Gemmatimonadetes bacterium]|nr:permease [Gemmatimonadota bacterium]
MSGARWLRERRFWRTPPERDVDDELAFHLAMRAELLCEAGLGERDAQDEAQRRFGDISRVRERCIDLSHERNRRMKRLEIVTTALLHARFALRRLRSAPGFAAAVIVMLALGIGAATAVFSVVDGILIRPLPFAEPERLVRLSHSIQISGRSTVDQSDGTILLYERHATQAFEHITGYRMGHANVRSAAADGTPERVAVAAVTGSFFPTLRATPVAGRVISARDDELSASPVIVISRAFWARTFGSDPRALGKLVNVDGVQREVIGVMPDGFAFPGRSDAWVPIAFDAAHANPASFNFEAVGRLRAGATLATARAELERYLPRLLDEFPSNIPREMMAQARLAPVVRPLRDAIVGDVQGMLWILLGAVGLLLIIACANVASLFLVRAEGAERDIAIRVALGAGRGVLAAQYLPEALLLSAAGGVLGTLLAMTGIRALQAAPNALELPRLAEVHVDARVVAFALLVTTVAAVLVSLLPVLRSRKLVPAVVLKSSSRSATAGPERQRARSALVVGQVALALVLVAGSALMARSFARLRDVSPGFEPSGVLSMRIAMPRATYASPASRVALMNRVMDEAGALPGVRSVAVTDWIPLSGDNSDNIFTIEEMPLAPNEVPPDRPLANVSSGFFAAMGIPLQGGRTFERASADKPLAEAVVSRAFAERYWKGQDPLGKRLRPGLDGPWFSVVGVVADVHMTALDKPADEIVYFPLVTPDGAGVNVSSSVGLEVRGSGDPQSLVAPLRAILRRADPALPTYDEQPLSQILSLASARTRFVLVMLGAASVIALLLGAVGLYGVLAYGVMVRRREIGVRMALGATSGDVTRMIARHGVLLAAIGVAAGLGGALATTHVLSGLLYDVSPSDPVTMGASCLVMLVVAGLASWLPARRAAAMDPMESLRRE